MPPLFLVVPAAAYGLLSLTLFFFPELLHGKKEHAFNPRHISHRGGAGERHENTIDAYRNALAHGTDMLELDVHLTKDNQVVVVHDANLYRLCGTDAHVRDLNYADLPPLRPTLTVAFSPGRPAVTSSPPPRMPLLRDVFAHFPTTPINIDLKAETEPLMEEVAKLIEEFQRAPLTVWGTASGRLRAAMHARLPQVSQFISGPRFLKFAVAFYLGLLPFLSFHEDFLELPLPCALLHLSRSRSHTLVLWFLDVTCMSRLLFFHARRRGMHVLLWVLNDEAPVRRAFALGATGVMTDYPQFLAELLSAMDQEKRKKN